MNSARPLKNFDSTQLSAAVVAIQRRWHLWRSKVAPAIRERLEADLLQPSPVALEALQQQQEAIAAQQSIRSGSSAGRKQLPIGAAPTRALNRSASRGPAEHRKQWIEKPSTRHSTDPAENYAASPTRRWGSGACQASARSPSPGNARKASRGAGLSYYPRRSALQQHDQ